MSCKYFPCHDKDKLESCLFCYCPIYPCYINETGGKNIDSLDKKNKIWDCSECTVIHNRKLAEKIQKYIKKQVKNKGDTQGESR